MQSLELSIVISLILTYLSRRVNANDSKYHSQSNLNNHYFLIITRERYAQTPTRTHARQETILNASNEFITDVSKPKQKGGRSNRSSAVAKSPLVPNKVARPLFLRKINNVASSDEKTGVSFLKPPLSAFIGAYLLYDGKELALKIFFERPDIRCCQMVRITPHDDIAHHSITHLLSAYSIGHIY